MKKMEIIAGSCLAFLVAAGIGQWRRSKPAEKPNAAVEPSPPPAETRPLTAEEVVAGALPSLQEGTGAGRQIALGGLLEALEGPELSGSQLAPETAESFAKASLSVTESLGPEVEVSTGFKARLAAFLASRTQGPTSRAYVMKVLEEGPDDIRQALLPGLGAARGVGGRRVFEKVSELGSKGMIAAETLPGVLRRTGGKMAAAPILALMDSTESVKVISACAIALQDIGEPEYLGPALERLEKAGLIDRTGTLPWISARLFSKHLETAQGPALARAVKVMKARPSLVRHGLSALETALQDGDPETRRDAAAAVKKAVLGRHLGARRGEELLAGRLSVETEPVLRAELSGGLEQVRGMPREPEPQANP